MTKKYKQSNLNTKPNYVHPSLGGGGGGKRATAAATAAEPSSPSPGSVNERLAQLRVAQASPGSAERKRELAELSNQKSLPPSLGQGILGLAPTAAPRPRAGVGGGVRSRIRFGTAGPAAPPSWQSRSARTAGSLRQVDEVAYRRAPQGARSFGKKTATGAAAERRRPEKLAGFLASVGDEIVPRRSLLHLALQSAAENWDAVAEDCLDDLEYLPVHLRAALLSYLAYYGPEEGIDTRGLQGLFPGQSDATCLDLCGLAGWSVSMKELKKWLATAPRQSSLTPSIERKTDPDDETLESWDEEVQDKTSSPSLPPALTTRHPFLTKLSLANPPPSISWSDLLSLSKHLGTLTHLSLAHWPTPTRTPNMKTASYTSRTSDAGLPAGAMTLYSEAEHDFQEAKLILHRLSENTYCLRWLDLAGCAAWIPALNSFSSSSSSSLPLSLPLAGPGAAEWSPSSSSSTTRGPDWRGAWRNVAYLNLSQSQSWKPGDSSSSDAEFPLSAACKGRVRERYFALSTTHLRILEEFREEALRLRRAGVGVGAAGAEDGASARRCHVCFSKRDGAGDAVCGVCTAYYDYKAARVARWLSREESAWTVGRSIIAARAGGGNSRCTFDHGWQKKETYETYAVYARA